MQWITIELDGRLGEVPLGGATSRVDWCGGFAFSTSLRFVLSFFFFLLSRVLNCWRRFFIIPWRYFDVSYGSLSLFKVLGGILLRFYKRVFYALRLFEILFEGFVMLVWSTA